MQITKDTSTHPANGPLTEERLSELANFKPSGSNVVNSASREEWQAMARQLLASMEQESVIEVSEGDVLSEIFAPGTKLYTAPQLPQPAVDQKAVESLATDLMKRIDKITGERHSVATLSSLRVSIVEACRAAMLPNAQGDDHATD